jgi:putative membrane protein
MVWWGPGWGWVGGLVSAVVWIAIIVAAVLLLRGEVPKLRSPHSSSPAVRTLEERYARGEIDRGEFLQRRAVLLAGSHGSHRGPGGADPGPPPPPPPPAPPGPDHPPAAPPGPASEPPGAVARAETISAEPTEQLPTGSAGPEEPDTGSV